MNIADLKARKKALKLSVKELAILADLPNSTVSKIFTGETKNPSYLTVEKINAVIVREEARHRAEAYLDALHKYLDEHRSKGGDEADIEAFQQDYRKMHNLNDAPIPFARDKGEEPVTIGELAISPDGLMTVDEFMTLGEGRFPKYELLNGHLIIEDRIVTRHGRTVSRLAKAIDRYIDDHDGSCEVFSSGVGVRFDDDKRNWLEPDIAVVCNPDNVDDIGINKAPDWVIEVTSPSTRSYDYNGKKNKYLEKGVREYWIVDLQKDKVTTWLNSDPDTAHIYGFDDTIPVFIYDGQLAINIQDISQ